MRGQFLILSFTGLLLACAGGRFAFPASGPPQEGVDVTTDEAGGEHLRIETAHGPLNLWHPSNYNPRTAGIVIYIHGYFTSVDQTWTDDQLATQFHDSGRNALFIAIEAPQASDQEVRWNSLGDLLRTVEDRAPYPLPRGPLVVVIHSGGYRTLLEWLGDSRVQHVILLDGLYGGEAEFRFWLHPHSHTKPHRMVLVGSGTWQQSSQFARHISGTSRRREIPAQSSSFTPRETHARLFLLRSQYDHNEIVSSGKVIPLLLQISPLKTFPAPKARPAHKAAHKPPTTSH